MSLVTVRRALIVAFLATLLSACGGRGSSAPPPVGGLTVTPGDGQVVVTWTPDPGVEYWLFYAPTTYISTDSLSGVPGLKGLISVTTPLILPSLVNGQLYSFTLDGRYDGGPGGPGTPSVSATPRLAGTSWTAGGAMGSADMRGVAWGAITPAGAATSSNYYLAAGAGGALYQSTDGVTTAGLNWTQNTTSGITANLNAAVYTLGKFIVVGDLGTISSSADLATWSAGTSVNNTQNLNAVASNGARVVAVGDGGLIEYSGDGISWTAATSVPAGTPNLYGVSYLSSGLWMAVGQNCTLLSSSDGSTWTTVPVPACSATDLTGVAYRGASTTTVTIPTTTTTSIAASYVLVGKGGLVLSSPDAVTWTAQTSNTTANLLTISSVPNQFLAVGAGGAAITSPDGLTWTAQNTSSGGPASTLYGLSNAQGQYVAVGGTGSGTGTSLFSR